MNRGRSSDSLGNGVNDIISSGSSSPTNFTSDDENGDPCALNPSVSNKSRITNYNTHRKQEPYSRNLDRFSERMEQALHNAMTLLPPSGSLSGHTADNFDTDSAIASTSYYNKRERISNIDLHPSRIPDVVPDRDSLAILRNDECFNERMMYKPVHFSASDNQQISGSSTLANIDDLDDLNSRDVYLEQNPRIDQVVRGMSVQVGPGQNIGNLTTLMCARMVECRTLASVIEFVDYNRELIDNLTRIVTREAPAFREYDMSNYLIDHSVKESFNPNFWLDREPVITTADGNCQYHAVSISLTGSEMYTQEVRLATAVAVIDNRDWFDSMLKLIDRGTVLDLVHTIARSYCWGDETTLKAIAVAIKRRIFLYTCNIGKKDYEMVKSLSKEELLDAFKEKKYRGGTGIHTYADPMTHVTPNNYIMLFHKSEHFIAVLPTNQQPTMFEPYNPIVPTFC